MARLLPAFGTILLGGLLPLLALGQKTGMPQTFASSTVVLTNGDTLRGSLVLHTDLDVLLITMADKTVRTVPALSVRTFAVRSEIISLDRMPIQYRNGVPYNPLRGRRRLLDVQRARPFLVYAWNHDREYDAAEAPAFFERLSGGPVILLRRQRLVQRVVPTPDVQWPGSYALPTSGSRSYYTDVREMLYLGTPQGSIVSLRKPRRDLLTYFQAEAGQIERYAEEHGLNFNDSSQLARLVDYANSLRAVALQ